MAVKNLTVADFESTIRGNPIVLVDFSASWCSPCRTFAPIFQRSAGEHPDVLHATVDIETQRELAAAAHIRSVPTTMAFRDGIVVYNQPGVMPLAQLKALIQKVRALDMTAIHTKIAQREASKQPRPGART